MQRPTDDAATAIGAKARLAAAMSLVVAIGGHAFTMPPDVTVQTAVDGRAAQVDEVFAEFTKPGSPGCAVAVSERGQIAGLSSAAVAQTTDPAEAAIRSARAKWNRAIEKRDATALRGLLSESFHGIGGAGHILDRDTAASGATRLFMQRPDLFYEYRPVRIRVVADHGLASEYGEWIERWKEPSGMTEMRGTYYVLWRRFGGEWLIEGEVEMPESCVGSDYCKPR